MGWRRKRRVSTVFVLALCMPACAWALAEEDKQARLKAIEAELAQRSQRQEALAQRAADAGRQAEAISRELVAAAADAQSVEARVVALEERIANVMSDITSQEAELADQREEMAQSLAALQRLSQRPPAVSLFRPAEAAETVQAAGLLSSLVPALRQQAEEIGAAVESLRLTRIALELDQETLSTELAQLEAQTQRLELLLAQRESEQKTNEDQAREEQARIARLVAESQSLQELINALDAERERVAQEAARRLATTSKPDLPQSASITSAQGALPMPAQGTIIRRFGEIEGAGHSRGIRIRTRSSATVVAPFDGRVVFAGPFRTYGAILIISHGDGYHSLLAGLDQIASQVGQWVLAGEPVGRMATDDIAAAGGSSAKQEPELYVEIRRGGEPINPLSWLATGNRKVG